MVVVSIFRWLLNLCGKEKKWKYTDMKQIQPFQKHWLQITSIVVCRFKKTCICSTSTFSVPASVNAFMTFVLLTNGFNRTDSYHMRIISCTNLQRNDVPWVYVNAPMYAYATWLYFIVSVNIPHCVGPGTSIYSSSRPPRCPDLESSWSMIWRILIDFRFTRKPFATYFACIQRYPSM